MAITRTGNFTENPANGGYRYGNGAVGGLTVNGGSIFDMVATGAGASPTIVVGNNVGGNGTLAISGAGSRVRVAASGNDDAAGGAFGQNGGKATVSITAGGSFEIYDPSTAAVPGDGTTGEYFHIGRGTGSQATVDVNAGNFSVIGGAYGVNIGRDGGNGSATFSNGSTLLLRSVAQGNDNGASLHIGRGVGAVGQLVLDASTATVETSWAANLANSTIGREGGQGSLTVRNNSVFTLNGAGGTNLAVGRQTGTGTADFLTGSSVTLTSLASSNMVIGVDATSHGTLNVSGSSLTVSGDVDASLRIGNNAGTGEATLASAASVTVVSDGYVSVDVGQAAGSGELNVTTGASLELTGGDGADLVVARDAGSTGTMTIDDASVYVDGKLASGNATIGAGYDEQTGGVGALTLSNGASLLLTADTYTDVRIGTHSGDGSLTVESGSTLTQQNRTTDGGASVIIGASGGTGTVFVDGGTWSIISTAYAGIYVGNEFEQNATDAGNGTLVVEDGGLISLDAPDGAEMLVGGGPGSSATVEILTGGVIDLGGSDNLVNGEVSGTVQVGRVAAATLTIDGSGSKLTDFRYTIIGANPFNTDDAGNGILNLRNSASIGNVGSEVGIGLGGTFNAGTGTVAGDLTLAGGKLDMRNGQFDVLTVSNDVGIQAIPQGLPNALFLDVGSAGNDRIVIQHAVYGDGTVNAQLNTLGGFKFTNGETRVLFQIAIPNSPDNDVITNLSITGQNAEFSYFYGYLASNTKQYVIQALNSGATGGLGILDFGAASAVGAHLVYNGLTSHGDVWGGRFMPTANDSGEVVNIDNVLGTGVGDSLVINNGSATQNFRLEGRGGNDTLQTGAGADYLDGGAGDDSMEGGFGNDTYVVDSLADKVVEATGGGTLDVVIAAENYVLAFNAEVEFMQAVSASSTKTLRLTGNDFGQSIYGNAGINYLTGRGGADFLFGRDGDDTLSGGLGDDSLNGGIGADTLRGDEGKDFILGGDGSDRAFGNDGDDTVNGEAGEDYLYGGLGKDSLIGGNDVDVDRMWGEDGDDLYYVQAGDRVYEDVGRGMDTVYASTRFTLTAGSEIEVLRTYSDTSVATIALTGNEFANTVIGNRGANEINGREGNDTLTGGLGNDVFFFDRTPNASTVDTITDFHQVSGDNDSFKLSSAVFLGLSAGTLSSGAFKNLDQGAADSTDRILYSQSTGELFWDRDGSLGTYTAIKFADLIGSPVLSNADFLIV